MQTSFRRDGWPVALGLVLLSLVPILAGTARLVELGAGADITAANARFIADPAPVVLHIVFSSLFAVLGAFQFAPGLRRHFPRWHRIAGRFVVMTGLITALTGLYMTIAYDIPAPDGVALYWTRLAVGIAMLAFLVLGLAKAFGRDFTAHKAHMIRAYAIGLGAGTQVITHLPYLLLVGMPDETARAILMGAGWAINIVFAEWIIRRGPKRRGYRAA